MESRLGMPSRDVARKRGRMVGKKEPIQGTRNRPVTGECITTGQRLGNQAGSKALVELLFNDPEVTGSNGPSPSNLRAIRCYEKAGFERQGTVTTPDGPAVYMVQTRQAFERTRSVANPFHPGTSKGWRPWPPLMSNVKHHEGSGDRRSIDSTIREMQLQRRSRKAISNRRCWPYICTAPPSGWRPEATQ